MIKLNKFFGCALSVAVTAGFTVDAMASEFARERAASSMYGKIPAEQRMMRSGRVAPPWFRMPPQAWTPPGRYLPRPDFMGRAGYPVQAMPARAPRQPVAAARYQRPLPAPAFSPRPAWKTAANTQYRPPMPPPAPVWARAPRQPVSLARYQRPMPRNTNARIAQYRPPMPPPAPVWARAPRQPVNLARYQRPMPRNTDARIAQYRPLTPPPAPVWARAPRQPVNLARYQRSVPAPAFNRYPVAPRVAQYRPLTPPPAPMRAQAPRQLTAPSPAKTPTLQAQKGESQELGKAGDTAELAAFESSPTETPRLQAQKGGSDDRVQSIDSSMAEPVAAVPPLLARPSWMKQVPDGS